MSPASRPSFESFPLVQQEIARLAPDREVRSAMEWLERQEGQFVRWQLDLAKIPAPPFGEGARSDWLAGRFHDLGLNEGQKDSIGNVLCLRPGAKGSILSI